MGLFSFLLARTSEHLQRFHFTHISTPIIESTELFKRAVGEQTDVVSKEMYTLNTHDDAESLCLRPEGTAPIVRAFIEHGIQQMPWKVFTWGPMFRYERPQKGRFRQFHQVTIEVIGAASVAHDALFIAMLDQLFHEQLQLNSYALHLNFLGCHDDRAAFKQRLDQFLTSVADQLCAMCKKRQQTNILRVFDCKVQACQTAYEQAPHLADKLCTTCATEWQQVQDQLDALSVTYTYNPRLVRGLDYYNKTVFEFVSAQLGAQNAFCGGGRYDTLVKQLGGKQDQPSLGAAIGIERVLMLLEPIKDKLPLPTLPALNAILPLGPEQQTLALITAQLLTHHGFAAEVLLEGGSMKSLLRRANKLGARYALIIGTDEQQKNEIAVKDMTTGDTRQFKQGELIAALKR